MSHEQQTRKAGVATAPQEMPEQIRLTLLATITGRLIEVRHRPESIARTHELSRLIPAAEWLTGDTEGGASAKH